MKQKKRKNRREREGGKDIHRKRETEIDMYIEIKTDTQRDREG